jgi:hypothetical protein
LNPAPTKSWNKPKISAWLWDREIYHEEKWTNPQLLALAHEHREQKRLAAVEIARDNGGHEVVYTPPYHPELQPIELIWGQVKARIASAPSTTMSRLKARLLDEFRDITVHDLGQRIYYNRICICRGITFQKFQPAAVTFNENFDSDGTSPHSCTHFCLVQSGSCV